MYACPLVSCRLRLRSCTPGTQDEDERARHPLITYDITQHYILQECTIPLPELNEGTRITLRQIRTTTFHRLTGLHAMPSTTDDL